MSLHSPKAAFRLTINFDNPQQGIGSSVSYSGDNLADLKHIAEMMYHAPRTVEIMQNTACYPAFNWQEVASYRLEK